MDILMRNAQYKVAQDIIMEKVAYGLLVRTDRNRYGKLIEEIENSFLKGNNDYPTTPMELLLVNYKNFNSNKRTLPQGGLDQDNEKTEVESEEICQLITATALMTKTSILDKKEIDPMWILCDNESKVVGLRTDGKNPLVRSSVQSDPFGPGPDRGPKV
jgi:hypothetical protein